MRRWGLFLTLAAALCLALVAAVALVGWSTMPIGRDVSAAATEDLRPLAGQVEALHAVPTLVPGGVVEQYYPDRAALEDETHVRAGLTYLADQMGLGFAMPQVFAALDALSANLQEGASYPFPYPELEAALAPLLAPSVVSEHADLLHEMAALAMLAAAHDEGVAVEPGGFDGALAFVVLRRLAEDPTNCRAHLDLAALVSLGQFPTASSVDETFEAAVDACPEDPTARWWWVQVQAIWGAERLGMLGPTGVGRAEAMQRPLRTARAWVQDQPGSALAWASEAEALVLQAETLAIRGIMPFTVRARARMALDRFRTADGLEHDPAFVVGQARALSALGEHAEAADTMAGAVAEAPDNEDFHVLFVTLLERAQRWDDAAEQAAAPRERFSAPSVHDVVPDLRGLPAGLVGLGTMQRMPVVVADPTNLGQGAGGVDWLGYIPDFRVTGPAGATSPWCANRARLRNLLLAGRAEEALAVPDGDPAGCDHGRDSDWDPARPAEFADIDAHLLRAAAHDELGETEARDAELAEGGPGLARYFDETQNLWRYAGDLEHAEDVIRRWLEQAPGPFANVRLGEVLFLQERYGDAVEELAAALEVPALDDHTGDPLDWTETAAAQTLLVYGTALERAGRTAAAEAVYRELAAVSVIPDEEFAPNKPFRLSVAAAGARLGLLALSREDEERAVRWLRPAAEGVREAESEQGTEFDPVRDSWTNGAEANNLAVALLGQDDVSEHEADEALTWALRAAEHDYESPIYSDTLALAHQENGDAAGAVASYRAALAGDPSLYQSWNNLGVLLDEQGDRGRAVAAFRSAVAARPDYALGWFNLGVVLGRSGNPLDFVASQRALARAVRLDPSYRGRSDTVEKDRSVVLTGLDVSRPIPADWRFVDTATEAAPGLSLVVLLLAVWRLVVALGLDQVGGWVGGRLLRGDSHRRWARVWARVDRFTALAWAFAASLVVVSWPVARGAAGQWWQLAVVAVALLASLWLYVTVTRWQAARYPGPPESRPVYRGWAPGMAFGMVSSFAGYAFVPVPVNAQRFTDHRVRRAGPLVLAAVAGGMLGLGFVTGAPVARLVGVGALAMLSTALFPLKPYDGGYLRHRGAAVVSSLALVGVSSALVLGWL